MKKMIWLTTLSILFLLFIAPGILVSALDMIPANDQPGYDSNKRLSIYGEKQISQKFISRDKNLTAIGTSIRNPNLKNQKEIVLNLYDKDKNLIRSSILSGKNIEDGDFVKFVFQSVPDSNGKEYSFSLSSSDAGTEETIEVFIIEPTADIIDYFYEDETHLGGIPIVTFHKPDSKLEIVIGVYSNWLSRLLSLDFQKI